MKKLGIFLVAVLLTVSACGCGEDNSQGSSNGSQTDVVSSVSEVSVEEEKIGYGRNEDFSYTIYTNHIEIKSYVGDDTDVIVPETLEGKPVTVLEQESMKNKKFTSITLPSSLTTISYHAFYRCENLKTVNFSEGLVTIKNQAFECCKALESIDLPDSLREIGYGAFEYCENLKTIKVSPNTIYIDSAVFDYTAWYEAQPTGLIYINNVLLDYKKDIDNICTVIDIKDGTVAISSHAFYYQAEIETVNIPSSVGFIGAGVFHGCNSLENITLPEGITEISDSLFDGCYKLTTLTIPSSVTYIGKSAFCGCYSLENITLPEGITEIAKLAFASCDKFENVVIPNSVTKLGESVFYECNNLKTVYIPSSVTWIGNDKGDSNIFNKSKKFENIIGEAGSYAETYAKNNDIAFVAK